jgi:hypothetical protein
MTFSDFFDNHPILCMLVGSVVIVAIIVLSIIFIEYSMYSYEVEVTQNGFVVYEGIAACVNVGSSGDTTTIKINQGFLCMFPKKEIVGKGIEVRTK